jgi:hypothetical protein
MLKFLSLLGSERLGLQDMIYLAEGFLGFFVSLAMAHSPVPYGMSLSDGGHLTKPSEPATPIAVLAARH